MSKKCQLFSDSGDIQTAEQLPFRAVRGLPQHTGLQIATSCSAALLLLLSLVSGRNPMNMGEGEKIVSYPIHESSNAIELQR